MTSPADATIAIQLLVATLVHRWRAGGPDGWDDVLAPGAVVLGAAADQIFLGADEVAAFSSPLQAPADAAPVEPDLIRVGVAPSGRSGWFWGFPTSTGAASTAASRTVRVSGAVTRGTDDRWTVAHVYLSHALPNDRLAEYQSAAPTLTLLPDAVAPGAEPLVDLLHPNMGVERLDSLPRRDDVVIIGTDPTEVYEGATAYLDAFTPMRAQLEQLQPTMQIDVVGGIRAAVTPDGHTGYFATHLTSTVAGTQLPTFRLGWVFSRVDGNAFRLVCDHHAFPTPPSAH